MRLLRKGWVPDAGSVDRILAAVARTPHGMRGQLTEAVNQTSMQIELMGAAGWFSVVLQRSSKPAAKNQISAFQKLEASARRFKEQLAGHIGKGAITLVLDQPTNFLIQLDQIIEAASWQKGANKAISLHASVNEWFTGEILPEVYKRIFRKRAGITHDGPYPRFAVAVMMEMGIHIAPSTVVQALKIFRAGRRRRKNREQI
jgi:hypothetical protein